MQKRQVDVVEEQTLVLESGSVHNGEESRKVTKMEEHENHASARNNDINHDEIGEFEDAFEDEVEEEEMIIDNSDNEDLDMEEEEEMTKTEEKESVRAYLPGDELQEGEVLDFDPSAYKMLHSMSVEWPCLSFDIVRDNLGEKRQNYPATTYLVAGTQADKWANNKIIVMKASKLHKMRKPLNNEESDDDEDDDDMIDEDPILEHHEIKHYGGVNRIRLMPHPEVHIVSSWSDTGKVHIWDISTHVKSFDNPGTVINRKLSPVYTVNLHGTEGFSMDWSTRNVGRLLTGDCNKRIYLTERHDTSGWITHGQSFSGHKSSVEDLHWSPSEDNVFASCSVDQTIKIWDTRMKEKCGLGVHAHNSDVNVISWNPVVPYLMASGGDDGIFKIWDLRNMKDDSPSAEFHWHKKAITAIEWHPTDEAQLLVSGEDDQVTMWDFSVEKDNEEIVDEGGIEIPSQLMFIHQGQESIKEVHWHKQLKDVVISTALSGFNIFKTSNSS